MNKQAKQNILARLRNARSDASPHSRPQPHHAENSQRSQATLTTSDIQEFNRLLRTNHTEVIDVSYTQLGLELARHLEDFDQDSDANSLRSNPTGRHIVSNHPRLTQLLEDTSLDLEALTSDNIQKDWLFSHCQSSLCYADFGVIDRGALILKASTYQPRSLSLVPPISMIVIEKKSLVHTLQEALANPLLVGSPLPSNLIFISGPSKTADIQQTLAYGAHGPKRLIVFLVA